MVAEASVANQESLLGKSMTRPKVSFTRTTTTDCETEEVKEDLVTARLGDKTIATLKRFSKVAREARDKSRWSTEWAAYSLLQADIEQVLAKLVELNSNERSENDEE